LKFGLFDLDARESWATGLIDWTADPRRADLVIRPLGGEARRAQVDVSNPSAAVEHAVRGLVEVRGKDAIAAVGHRVVHGGTALRQSVKINASVKDQIKRLAELAPLHNPPALVAIEAAERALPQLPQVAVFDTAFFASLPPRAFVYPVPYKWYSDWGIRRFGFHGISHAFCSSRAAEILTRPPAELRLVICHLGNGCSASAVRGGAAVATTMGFTPLDGLMMGSRSGSVDPGILLHVQRQRGLSAEQLDQALNHASGLLGVSGISSDYRAVEEAARQGNERASLALDIYADRVREVIGALTVTLGGLDALIFTAGVGENAVDFRATVCTGLECVGMKLDRDRNRSCRPDADIAAAESRGRILVIHTREELMIAREVRRVLLT
jgi:acetate kinase